MKGYKVISKIKEVPTAEVIVKFNDKEYNIKDVHWTGYANGGKMQIILEVN